jgi:hypothetical protein
MCSQWGVALVGVAGAVIGGVAGGLVGGLMPVLSAWWVRPQLAVDFKNEKNNIVISSGTEDVWLRVRVHNHGHRRAIDCQVFLTAMYKVRSDASVEPDPVLTDAKFLQWAGGKKMPIPVPQGVDFYADLLHLPKGSGGWGMIFGLYSHQADLDQFTGTYEFHLMVSGENAAPARCKIRVGCKEIGKTFDAWQVT